MSDTVERMIVPIAIRSGMEARVQIPVDLTRAEAEKIARVVLAYAAEQTGDLQTAENPCP